MSEAFSRFEEIVRKASNYTEAKLEPAGGMHPFEERNIHPKLPSIVRNLFDNGYYAQATFEAYKFLDKEVQKLSLSSESGFKLAMQAFAVDAPLIKLTNLLSKSEKNEQKGYQFIFFRYSDIMVVTLPFRNAKNGSPTNLNGRS